MTLAPAILVVDNDKFDQICFRRFWNTLQLSNPVTYANDGLEALKKLRGEGNHAKIEEPCVIFLDLDMPNMNGMTFLETLRGDAQLNHLKVFICSSNIKYEDINKAEALGVSGFILKHKIQDSLRAILKDETFALQRVA